MVGGSAEAVGRSDYDALQRRRGPWPGLRGHDRLPPPLMHGLYLGISKGHLQSPGLTSLGLNWKRRVLLSEGFASYNLFGSEYGITLHVDVTPLNALLHLSLEATILTPNSRTP
ncbi:hypothetical protein KSP40_PGU018066 [Platanthera guangdongensis]|uniref:Uncharacterized protein n=1 Tax=Platanthera guangdongensis TaxID=2320717 RepID=A0ABR2MW16_9ASPA